MHLFGSEEVKLINYLHSRCYTPDELCQISGFKKCGDGYIFVNDVECRKPEEVHKCGEDIFLELYQPCNGTCPNNWRLGFCDSSTEVGHLLPDNGKCVLNTDQFDGKCPEGFEVCFANAFIALCSVFKLIA
jgi:hypothetical protein